MIGRLRFAGSVDGIVDRYVCGWVVDLRHRQRRLRVLAEHGSTARRTIADIYRADVQKAGLSDDGYCGFKIPLSLLEGDGDIRVTLSPAHRRIRIRSDRVLACKLLRHGTVLYHVTISGTWLSGFATDLMGPCDRRTLGLIEPDGRSSAHVACRFEESSKLTAAHDGFNGFRIPRPRSPVRLEDLRTGFELLAESR